jgi:hypothetical protein
MSNGAYLSAIATDLFSRRHRKLALLCAPWRLRLVQ